MKNRSIRHHCYKQQQQEKTFALTLSTAESWDRSGYKEAMKFRGSLRMLIAYNRMKVIGNGFSQRQRQATSGTVRSRNEFHIVLVCK